MQRLAADGSSAFVDEGRGPTAELLPIVYDQLRSVASSYLARERHGHTLQPTALVHEAYLRLVDESLLDTPAEDPRRRFVALAARAMRSILVDHARGRGAEKRGGAWQRVTWLDGLAATREDPVALIDLDAGLRRLEAQNERLARVAELRLFGGLTLREIAPLLDISPAAVSDDWQFARALLGKYMAEEEGRTRPEEPSRSNAGPLVQNGTESDRTEPRPAESES